MILVVKKRSEAKSLCEGNLIRINGAYAKPSKTVSPHDIIEIETAHGATKIRVLKIPEGNVRKEETSLYYEEVPLL